MPTVLRFDGFSVVVYPADHIPAHVHVDVLAVEKDLNPSDIVLGH
jgi:hypothetical protein